MEFKRNGKDYDILVGGLKVGRMYKDTSRSHLYSVVADFTELDLPSYVRTEEVGRTYKDVKASALSKYQYLLEVEKRHKESKEQEAGE